MALIPLSYCQSASNDFVNLTYDEATHVISAGAVVPDICPGGAGTGLILYSHVVGDTTYEVRTQNPSPYAYLVTIVAPACDINIASTSVGNASTNYASDGSILVNATASYPRSYSLDGVNWQSSNLFSGLAPGSYLVRARALKSGVYCYDQETAVVGFNTVTCELLLGTVVTTADTGSGNGTISINTLTNPPGLPVEYRIDSGAWQNSPVFNGLAAATYNVQVRYKDYTSCGDSRDVIVSEADCNVFIQDVPIVHEQSKYADDGQITIIATSANGPIEYSIDDGDNYQADNVFAGLSPGVYQIRVKDANDCEDIREVEVFKYKKPYLIIPRINSHRFVILSGPMINANARQSFDNRLFGSMRFAGVSKCEFSEPVELADVRTIQFRSSYSNNLVRVYNAANALVGTLPVIQKTNQLNKSETMVAMFADAGANKTQIFFENGIPPYFEVGQDVTIAADVTLDGTYEIEEFRAGTGSAEGYEVMIVDKQYTSLTPLLSGDLTVVYDIEPYEVFEFTIVWGDYAAGKYYMKIDGIDPQLSAYAAQSEPVLSRETWDDRVLVKYRNNENDFEIDYSTGIVHAIRVKGVLEWPTPGSKRTVYEDSRDRLIKLEGRIRFLPELKVYDQPYYMLMKLAAAFEHDYFEVDDTEYQSDQDMELEYIQNDPTGNGKVKLRQVDYIAENSDDLGANNDVDINILGTNDTLLGVP